MIGSWRVALRIARRAALRHPGRSAFVLLMLFLPAYAGTILVTAWANLGGAASQQARFEMGAADWTISTDDPAALHLPAGSPHLPVDNLRLPPGSRSTVVTAGRTILTISDRPIVQDYEAADVTDPVNDGRYVLRSGRPPTGASEIAVSSALHLKAGSTISAGMPQRQVTVVGIIDTSRSLRAPVIIAGAPLSDETSRDVFVDLPPEASDWSPPATPGIGTRDRRDFAPSLADMALQAATFVIVAGFSGAQIVALVGASFLVSARRQERELRMISAVGATARQIRRLVLANGLLLGTVAAITGAALGLLTFLTAGPLIETVADHPLLEPSIPLTAIALVSATVIAIGLLAAYLPARTVSTQQAPRTHLGVLGRRRTFPTRGPRVETLIGSVALVVGTVALVQAANPDGRAEVIAGGAVAVLAGLICVTPALIRHGGTALAGRLGLSGRIAIRHASRHHLRTASAVAAVTAAIAGSAALALVAGAHGETSSTPARARPGMVLIPQAAAELLGPDGLRQVTAALPTRHSTYLRIAGGTPSERGDSNSRTSDGDPAAVAVPATASPRSASPQSASPQSASPQSAAGTSLDQIPDAFAMSGGLDALAAVEQRQIAVGDVGTVSVVLGRNATIAEADVLRRGGAVAVNDTLVSGDSVTVGGRTLPAVVAQRGVYQTELPGLIMSAETARRLGLGVSDRGALIDTSRMPTTGELATANELLLRQQLRSTGTPTVLTVYSAPKESFVRTGTLFYVLAAVSALITVTAAVVAVGLSASEMKTDLTIMAAVGATPRISRRIRTTQAVLIVGLAAPLGLLAGLAPAAGYVAYNVTLTWHVPWSTLALVLLVPVVSTLAVAALPTRRSTSPPTQHPLRS